jgi:hypothetical protein
MAIKQWTSDGPRQFSSPGAGVCPLLFEKPRQSPARHLHGDYRLHQYKPLVSAVARRAGPGDLASPPARSDARTAPRCPAGRARSPRIGLRGGKGGLVGGLASGLFTRMRAALLPQRFPTAPHHTRGAAAIWQHADFARGGLGGDPPVGDGVPPSGGQRPAGMARQPRRRLEGEGLTAGRRTASQRAL